MWFYFSLAGAIFSALAVLIHKQLSHKVRFLTFMWVKSITVIPIIAIFALRNGIPELSILFVFAAIASAGTYTFAKLIQIKAMRLDNLSKIQPLAILSPLIVLVIATLPPLSELPKTTAILGVLISLFGAYLLNIQKAKENILEPFKQLAKNKASRLMIFYIIIISFTTVFDKIAIKNTFPQTSAFALLVEDVIIAVVLTPILFKKVKNWKNQVMENSRLFVALATVGATANLFVFTSLGGGNIGVVSTILRTQILFVLLFSYIFLKDKPKPQTVVATLIMIAGVVLIKLGS